MEFIMKRQLKSAIVPVCMLFLVSAIFTACVAKPKQLTPPENVTITIEGRDMTVTWDAVKNAQGYTIVLASEGCSSGNRTVDTREGTFVVTSSGRDATNVEITGETSLQVRLMAARGDRTRARAAAVTAKVMSLGGNVSKKVYEDSDYSQEVRVVNE
jgi:predicted component of type VI protein secretion system